MSSVTVRKSDGQTVTFRDTIGHQIGNGAVQIMKGNGEQVIFNNFIDVEIKLNAKEKKSFKASVALAEAKAKVRIEAMEQNAEANVPVLSVVEAPAEVEKPNNDGAEVAKH